MELDAACASAMCRTILFVSVAFMSRDLNCSPICSGEVRQSAMWCWWMCPRKSSESLVRSLVCSCPNSALVGSWSTWFWVCAVLPPCSCTQI